MSTASMSKRLDHLDKSDGSIAIVVARMDETEEAAIARYEDERGSIPKGARTLVWSAIEAIGNRGFDNDEHNDTPPPVAA